MSNYILEGKEPKQVDDTLEWARWFETGNRIVEQTEIGDVKISTVFLGLDHSFEGGTPLLFETMIFGGAEDQYQKRYATWDEAVKGHQFACEKVSVKGKLVEETKYKKVAEKLLDHYNSMWNFVDRLCKEKDVKNPYPSFTKNNEA